MVTIKRLQIIGQYCARQQGVDFFDAAPPLDVRKVYDLPEDASMNLGATSLIRGAASLIKKPISRKGRAFPHIRRQSRSPATNLDRSLERRIMTALFSS